MLITDRFVVLNNPKTGSTFVRKVLNELHLNDGSRAARMRNLLRNLGLARGSGMRELMLPPLSAPELPPNQHGTFSQIPAAHRTKDVVSVVRDPFARFLSVYRFRWWADHPRLDSGTLAREFPGFPELSLEEFIRFEDLVIEQRLPGRGRDLGIGWQTIRFIEMFFRDPLIVLDNLDSDYLDSDRFVADLPPIRFLQTETLNQGLFDFLKEHGYPDDHLHFILGHARVNGTQRPEHSDAWTAETVERIVRKERLLFRILGHLGFHYPPPATS